MNHFDLIVVVAMVVSIVYSSKKGGLAELFDIGAWIIAFFVAKQFTESVAQTVFANISPYELAAMCAFVSIFFFMRIAQKLFQSLLDNLPSVKKFHKNKRNQFIGAIFGALKATVLISTGVFIASFSSIPAGETWQSAKTSHFFEKIVSNAVPQLFPFFKDQIFYPQRVQEYPPTHQKNAPPPVDQLYPKSTKP